MVSELVDRFIHKYGRLPTEFDPDYLEMLRMSKYRIMQVPDVGLNTKCANCGSSKADGRKYIDFGLDLDWYGPVYLCGSCLHDIANEMGLFDALTEQLKKANDSLLDIRNSSKQGSQLRNEFTHIFEEVKAYVNNLPAASDDPAPNPSPYVEPDKAASESGTDEIKSGTDDKAKRTTKSTASSGRKDVPSLADLLSLD